MIEVNAQDPPCVSTTQGASSFCHHHLHKLLVVDLAIAINISFTDHFIDFFVCEFLAQVCHDMAQLCRTDEAIAIAVKHLEGLNGLLLCVGIFHLPCHQ